MRSVPLLLMLLAAGFSACRELPSVVSRLRDSKATPPAAAASTPTPAPAEAASPATPAINRNAQVVVLGYHRFVENVRHPDTEITPTDFEAQMKALKDGGITVISMADFLAWRQEKKDIPSKCALITIDDGYNVAYSVAWPILKKFGYPFTLFVYTDYIRGGPKSGGGSLSWEQLAEMRDAGVEIGSHSVSHRILRAGKSKAGDPAYEEWLWNELFGSKEQLETRLGIKVTAMALPYGLANDQVREMAANAGYEMVFTVNGEKIGFGTPMNSLGRYIIPSNQPKIFATAIAFNDGQEGGGPAVAAVAADPLDPSPADGSEIRDPRPVIRAILASVGPIEPGSVRLRVSGVGEVAAAFDPQTKMVSFPFVTDLLPGRYTVILAARTEGKKLEARWSFTIQAEDEAPSSAPPAAPR
jgi:peptidoglycan/xylan/chitin deacetylase (PgdA/CDA1 family)